MQHEENTWYNFSMSQELGIFKNIAVVADCSFNHVSCSKLGDNFGLSVRILSYKEETMKCKINDQLRI